MILRAPPSQTLIVLLAISALTSCGPPITEAAHHEVGIRQIDAAALQGPNVDARVRAFYAARAGRPAWTDATASQLRVAIGGLERHAIDGRHIQAMLVGSDPTDRELALTKAALAYGDALAHGLADPSKIYEVFAVDRNDINMDQALSASLDKGDLRGWLAGLAPQDADYAALSKAYVFYLKAAQQPQPPPIEDGKPIKPNVSDSRMAQIAQVLAVQGFYDPPANAVPTDLYGPALVEAVKRLQNQQGINDDGVIGSEVVQALNAGPADRARQIALNLEARRWLRRDVPPTRIEVNIASANLSYFKDGELVDSRRVVVGKPDSPTPPLSASFDRLVVNPPWNVPDEIAYMEIVS
ncbi:MAG: murein L,D-transpeptidase [Caulobacteraceae bacterium]|nr:murein L,D-transpeptidase [Caulobacteraceae bacterium]